MDNLEKFISNNKQQFNDVEPPSHIWNKLESELHETKKKRSLWRTISTLSIAAVGLLCLGIFIGSYAASDPLERALSQSSYDEFIDTEKYYAVKVNNYIQEIETVQPASNITEDLKQLDEVYNELKSELINSDMQNKDQIINAMIGNYHTKIKMLERILLRANKKQIDNGINKNSNEKLSI